MSDRREEMKRQLEDSFKRNEEISILPGFSRDSGGSRRNSRLPSEVPVQFRTSNDGSGDAATPSRAYGADSPTTYTARLLKSRKLAQIEYRTQLDQQIALQKQKKAALKEEYSKTEFISSSPILAGPFAPRNSPIIPPTPETKMARAKNIQSCQPSIASDKSRGAEESNNSFDQYGITLTPFPLLSSTSKWDCAVPCESIVHQETPSRHNKLVTPSSLAPQLDAELDECQEAIELLKIESIHQSGTMGSPSPQPLRPSKSPPIPILRPQLDRVQFHVANPEASFIVADVAGTSLPRNPQFPCQMSTSGTLTSPASYNSCFSPLQLDPPQVLRRDSFDGDSSCGSGFTVSPQLNSPFSTSPTSFKPHVSQTTDQRPDETLLRSAYKSQLEIQIQEHKRMEAERLEREKIQDERLQEKIRRDQERMEREYQEEQLRFKKKEEEHRLRQDEILKQTEQLRLAELARQKQLEEKRHRLTLSQEQNERLDFITNLPQPPSPPIKTHNHYSQVKLENEMKAELEPAKISLSSPKKSIVRPEHRKLKANRPSSGITESLQYLKTIRGILEKERTQVLYHLESQNTEIFS